LNREPGCHRSRGLSRGASKRDRRLSIDRGGGPGDYAITQHESGPTRRDIPGENDVRNAIDCITVSATRIEIVLNESIVSEGQLLLTHDGFQSPPRHGFERLQWEIEALEWRLSIMKDRLAKLRARKTLKLVTISKVEADPVKTETA
jgi:hypothetical protein